MSPNNQYAERLRAIAADQLGMESDSADVPALLAGAEALEAVEVAKAALEVADRYVPEYFESLGPGGYADVQQERNPDSDIITAALARLEGE